MTGRELADALLRAGSVAVDDCADDLARSSDGRMIIDRFQERARTYRVGPPQLSASYRAAAKKQTTRRKKATGGR